MQREKSRLESEVSKLSAKEENQHQVDVGQLTYNLETAEENLKLANSRNSLLGHEIESLTQELEQIKLHPQSLSIEGDGHALIKKIEAERDSCREQLKRLKQQMIQMQEDQEAALHWRVEAEVKLALEGFKKKINSDGGASKQELTALQKELQTAQEELKSYKAQVELKDAELLNLQIALGELTYHGEAADKLRRDLRAAQENIKALQDEILDGKAAVAEAQSARKAAEASADEAHQSMTQQRDKIQHLEKSLFSVKKELLDASQKLRRIGDDAGSMVDRRLVVQLLVTYLEKRHERDALEVMARMLGFTEEEKRRVHISAGGRGLLGSVAGGTLALVKGGMSVATLGLLDRGLNSKTGSQLADQWVDFLTKDTDAASQEDPLSYLQKGIPPGLDKESVKMTSSEASVSMQTYEDDGRRPQSYTMHRHSPTPSSRSEGVETPVTGYGLSQSAASEVRMPSRPLHQLPKTNMPSFRDFMEKQQHSRSDG